MNDLKNTWQTIHRLYKEQGRMPTQAEVGRITKYSPNKTSSHYRSLADRKLLSRVANSTQVKYDLVNPPIDMVALVDQEAHKEELNKKINDYSLMIAKVAMGLVSLICMAISIRFTTLFSSMFMPRIWAVLMAIAIVSFSAFSFTVSSYLEEKWRYLWYAMWVVAISYSITTGVAGQFEKYQGISIATRTQERKEGTVNEHREAIVSRIEMLTKDTELLHAERRVYAELLADIGSSPERRSQFSNSWNITSNNLTRVSKLIEENNSEIFALRKQSLGVQVSVEREDFFTYLSKVSGLSPTLLQFLVSIFPAIFIDLISPCAMAFALRTKRTNGK